MSSVHSKIWYLEQINLLRDLTEDELELVSDKTVMRTTKKNQYIYFPQEPSKVVFFLKAGRVKIGTYSDDGKEIIKTIIQPGEIFGELGIAGEETRKDFAIALDDNVRMCAINVDDIKSMMNNNPDLSMEITKVIGERLMRVNRQLESLIFKDANTRVIDFIKEMAEQQGIPIGKEVLLKHNLTHQDIANLTATSRQTVTTVLNTLKSKDRIHLERNKILIRDMNLLTLE